MTLPCLKRGASSGWKSSGIFRERLAIQLFPRGADGQIVGRTPVIATLLPQLVDRLTTVQDVLQSIDAAAAASREAPPTSGGLGGLWHMMRDPETQDTLRFLLSIGKQMRKDWGAGKK